MRKRGHPRLLLMEGADDRRLVPELVELGCGLAWEREGQPIVYIQEKGGIETMLLRGTIAAELLDSSRQVLGMIVDADDRPQERWSAIRELLLTDVADLDAANMPQDPPASGFIAEVDRTAPGGARRLGVWMMPDNRSSRMMETFVRSSISADELCGLAERSCDEATRLGAPYKRAHRDKAFVHTWLAWQDPPGRQLHDAIKQRMLDPNFPRGQAFLQWFRELFRV